MFYENTEFQLASSHVKNNNAFINNQQDINIGKKYLINQFTENIFRRKKVL